MLPIVTKECYFSLAQSLIEGKNTSFEIIKKENPVLAEALNNMFNDALSDSDCESRTGKLINTTLCMYRLLRNQDEADEMNKNLS